MNFIAHQRRIQNFSLEGAPIPRGRLPNILIIFSQKPYEIKEILVRSGARAGGAPLNPPLHMSIVNTTKSTCNKFKTLVDRRVTTQILMIHDLKYKLISIWKYGYWVLW